MLNLKKLKEKKKGFTLIELIVVIAIIGILAAVLLPRFGGFTDSARKKSAISEAKVVYEAMEGYYAEKGVYPKNKSELPGIKSEIGDKVTFSGAGANASFVYKYSDKFSVECSVDGKLEVKETSGGASTSSGTH